MLDDYLKELQKITLLEPDEERALWQAYKDNGDMMARSRLIEQYQPLVFKETMRWHIHRDILSDALQEGTLGLMEAVERYDYRRGVAFPLFAVHRIRGAILDDLKREGAVSAVSLDEPDERGVTLQDTLCDEGQDPAEATSRQLLLEKVGHVLKRLPEKEQAVVEGVYLNDVEQKHLAKSLESACLMSIACRNGASAASSVCSAGSSMRAATKKILHFLKIGPFLGEKNRKML